MDRAQQAAEIVQRVIDSSLIAQRRPNDRDAQINYRQAIDDASRFTGNRTLTDNNLSLEERGLVAITALRDVVRTSPTSDRVKREILSQNRSGYKRSNFYLHQVAEQARNVLSTETSEYGGYPQIVLNSIYNITQNPVLSPQNPLPLKEKIIYAQKYLKGITLENTDTRLQAPEIERMKAGIIELSLSSQQRRINPRSREEIFASLEQANTAWQNRTQPRSAPSSTAPKTSNTKADKENVAATGAAISGQVQSSFSKLGTRLGTAIGGPVGTAVGFVVGKVLGKVVGGIGARIGTFLALNKKHVENALTGGTLLGGLALGGPVGLALAAGMMLLTNPKGFMRLMMSLARLGLILTTIFLASLVVPVAGTIIVTIVFTVFVIYVINTGAYVVPPGSGVVGGPGTGIISPTACPARDAPRPTASGIIYSADGRYAFPIAPGAQTNNACYHWDNSNATDIFINGFVSGGYRPVLAYTSGTIDMAYVDSRGGNAIVLAGDDGRFYYYAHNCALYVQSGQRVNVGEVIATTDTTGSAATTASPIEHLHFAIGTDPTFGGNDQADPTGGSGEICPQWDFDQKFYNPDRCPNNTMTECRR